MPQKTQKNNSQKTEVGSIAENFGENLARILGEKISSVYKDFQTKDFVRETKKQVAGKVYKERLLIIAELLKKYLPEKYQDAIGILMQILGPENKEETGMFKNFYWIMPIGKYVELYGLSHFSLSMKALEEITKRNTGEYAIRSFARKYPEKTVTVCLRWAKSKNFHLRRLASEGLRPKLPWASKLDVWNENPKPIFEILDLLKEDDVKFVKKSVANHLRDWMKVNPKETEKIVAKWSRSKNEHTKWILKHASR